MSDVSKRARLTVVVSDFAMVDAAGKVNIVGAGVASIGFEPTQGLTSRFSVLASVDVPADLTPVEASIEILLVREGVPVELPGPAGPQVLRIGQAPVFEKPQAPVPMALRDQLESRHQMVLDFNTGLPLAPGAVYEWVLQIDGDEDNRLRYPFIVAPTPVAPVVG